VTAEQFQALLQELARAAGLPDASGLLDHGRLNIGPWSSLLVHDAGYDPELLQVRMNLGGFAGEQRDVVMQALLEANYGEGWGGECVFSLSPDTGEVALTMRLELSPSLSAQELWQALSDIAQQGGRMWEEIAASSKPARGMPAVSARLIALQAQGLRHETHW
jgi:hypothetical protein